MIVRGSRIPARLEKLAGEIPGDVRKALDAVSVVARCLAAEDYEGKAATARRTRDWSLAKGYGALAVDVLSAAAPDPAEDVAELLQKAEIGGVLGEGYRQRAAMASGGRPEDAFRPEAVRLLRAENGPASPASLGPAEAAVIRQALDKAGLTIMKSDKRRNP